MASSYGNHDAGCCARNFSALSLALAGEEERARAMIDQVARRRAQPRRPVLAGADALFHVGGGADARRRCACDREFRSRACRWRPSTSLRNAAGMEHWASPAGALAENGDPSRGLAMLDASRSPRCRRCSRVHFFAYLLGLLADARIKAGQHAEAMKAVEDGLAIAEATGERFYGAELHRLHGELLAHPSIGQKRKAQAAFRAADQARQATGRPRARAQGAREPALLRR